jgi:hypothetical protein
MKFLFIHAIYFALIFVSHQNLEDFRVMSKSGKKLSLLTGIYYNIVNEKTRKNWIDGHSLVQRSDLSNPIYWWKIDNSNESSNSSKIINGNGVTQFSVEIERADESNSYFIYSSGKEHTIFT